VNKKRWCYWVFFSITLISLCGCALGLKHDFSYQPPKGENIGKGKTLLVLEAADQRPEVVQGKEEPNWVGWQRTGVGIPHDITTADGRPFAEIITEVIIQDISSVGFICKRKKLDSLTGEKISNAVKETGAEKAIQVIMKMLHSDTINNPDVEWNLQVVVYDPAGKVIKTNEEKGSTELKGGGLFPHKEAAKVVPPFFHSLIRKLIVGNNEVMKTLLQ